MVSPDILIRSFEAEDAKFLLNPSQRQITIKEHHPRVRFEPDPKAAEHLPSCHSITNLTVDLEYFLV